MARETPMRFFLEETSFELPASLDISVIEERLEAFVALVLARHNAAEDVFRWSNLDQIEVQPGTLLCDLLYQQVASLPIDRELRQLLVEVINRCVYWDDRIAEPVDSTVEIAGETCVSPTAAVVHALLAERRGAACLSPGARPERSGAIDVRVDAIVHQVHFIAERTHSISFHRVLPEIEDMDADDYMANAQHAFPDIAFVPGLEPQLRQFKLNHQGAREDVTKHLAAINDHFQRLFKQNKGDQKLTMKQFAALSGVDATPESPKTHGNKKAMRERDVDVDVVLAGGREIAVGQTVACEWHTKIKWNTGRIHFNPGQDGVAEGKLVVGLFAKHLTV